ncbi:MAG: IclR family transcriptional regulator [Pseudomonadota bacterium]
MADAEQSRRRVQSIEVGFRVLRVLRMAEGPLPLRDVAARAAMPPSKVHLYLVSFVRENMAYQDPRTGFYGLGSFAIQLGLAAVRQLDVVGAAGEVLNDLRDRTDCAIYLSLWGDQGPCVVAKADGNLQGAFTLRLGYILPVGTTATGQVFVTWLPREDVERVLVTQYAASTPHMVRARDRAADLDAIAATVRERGYGSTAGRLNQNFAGLAAPIFDADGKLGAALTLLGPADYVSDERQTQFAAMLTEAAASVSKRVASA